MAFDENPPKPSKPAYLTSKLENFPPKLENFSSKLDSGPVDASKVAGWPPDFAHMFIPRVLPILRVSAHSDKYNLKNRGFWVEGGSAA